MKKLSFFHTPFFLPIFHFELSQIDWLSRLALRLTKKYYRIYTICNVFSCTLFCYLFARFVIMYKIHFNA